jgi:hypothetical protein
VKILMVGLCSEALVAAPLSMSWGGREVGVCCVSVSRNRGYRAGIGTQGHSQEFK